MRKEPKIRKAKCPLIMKQNLKRIIATVTQGEARILQASDSDVSLHDPEGSLGFFYLEGTYRHYQIPRGDS